VTSDVDSQRRADGADAQGRLWWLAPATVSQVSILSTSHMAATRTAPVMELRNKGRYNDTSNHDGTMKTDFAEISNSP